MKAKAKKKANSNKTIKILLIAAAAAIALGAIIIAGLDAFSMLAPDSSVKGNSTSNIANGGMAVMDELNKTVYYSNNGIYAKPADAEAYEVCADRAQSLAYREGVIYFCNMSDNNRCYSVDVKSGEKKLLNEELSVEYLNIAGDSIYFACIKEIDKRGIYKMGLDGGNLTRLSDLYVDSLLLYKDYLYFINKQDGNTLYRMNVDAKGLMKLTDSYTYCPVVSQIDNRIYFSDKEAVYSSNLDGRYMERIMEGHARSIAIAPNGALIIGKYDYTGQEQNSGVYLFENGEEKKIRDDEVMWLAVCDDKMYFKSMTQGMEVMRCDFNGENGVYVAGNEGSSMLS